MAEPTHEQIIQRVDKLEARVESVESGIYENRKHFDSKLGELKLSFREHASQIEGQFSGLVLAMKFAGGAVAFAVGVASLVHLVRLIGA